MQIHLRLAGAAANIPYYAGALEALEDLGIEPATIAGTSAGSIIGGAKASGMSAKEIQQLLFDIAPLLSILDPSWNPASIPVDGGQCLGQKLESILAKHMAKSFNTTKIPFACFTANMSKQQVAVWSTYTTPHESVAARCTDSSRIPLWFKPRWIHGEPHFDGGMVYNYPIDFKFPDQDNTLQTLGLMVKSCVGKPKVFKGLFKGTDVLLSSIDVLMAATTRAHIEEADWAKTIVLGPAGSSFDFAKDIAKMKAEMKSGYESVKSSYKAKMAK